MNRISFTWLCIAVLAASTEPSSWALTIGTAKLRITPPTGTPMAGYYHERASTGVHDDLYAKAIVLEQDGSRVALVALDLISTIRPVVIAARDLIEERTGIPGDHVMIHTIAIGWDSALLRGLAEDTGGQYIQR